MDVVGYVEQLSVAPGQTITMKASCTGSEFKSEVVRMLHGENIGPGYKASPVPDTTERHAGVHQPIRAGSYLRVPAPSDYHAGGFTISLWIQPVHLEVESSDLPDQVQPEDDAAPARWTLAFPPDPVLPQVIASSVDAEGDGWKVAMSPTGILAFSVATDQGTATASCTAPLLRTVWYHVVARVDLDTGEVQLEVTPQTPRLEGSAPLLRTEHVRGQLRGALLSSTQELLLGGLEQEDEHGRFVGSCFNGKLAGPRLDRGAAPTVDLKDPAYALPTQDLVAAWDLSRSIDSLDVIDVSGAGLHGRAWNRPGRGVTGPNWNVSTFSFHQSPAEYGAVSLHDDDLDDAAWTPSRVWRVPEDLPSGAYAFRLTTPEGATDHVPFVVTPPVSRPTGDVLLILPTFSYLAYANEHSLWAASDAPEDKYLRENRLQGLYDKHLNDPNADGVQYSSWRRPIMNMRPHYLWRALRGGEGSVHQFGADLHLIDWLEESGYRVDVVTDYEFDRRGVGLLADYRVVMTGTHAEYWSKRMLDGLETYVAGGGRVMYMSGNGLYWVTGLDEELEHTVEIRRSLGMSGGWYHKPGEGFLTTTGEKGGAWRERGLAPQRYVGVGTAAFLSENAVGRGGPFEMQPDSRNPRAAFIVDGLEDLKLLGDFPNLVNGWGPVGYEADRVDIDLGSPLHTLVIASAHSGTTDVLIPCFEETLAPNARADVAFFETASGGAVFSTGSISWAGSLHHNDYDNDVARMTKNVLNRFLDPEPFELPTLPAIPEPRATSSD